MKREKITFRRIGGRVVPINMTKAQRERVKKARARGKTYGRMATAGILGGHAALGVGLGAAIGEEVLKKSIAEEYLKAKRNAPRSFSKTKFKSSVLKRYGKLGKALRMTQYIGGAGYLAGIGAMIGGAMGLSASTARDRRAHDVARLEDYDNIIEKWKRNPRIKKHMVDNLKRLTEKEHAKVAKKYRL